MISHTSRTSVIWLTGVSGSGKSTIGEVVYKKLKELDPSAIYIDGDTIREIFDHDLGYSLEDRNKNAFRITRLCKFLRGQNISIVCAANLTSQHYRDWCRENIEGYFEVFLKVPIDVLIKRDCKGLYARAQSGEIKNVVGVDIPFKEPEQPNLVINNEIHREHFDELAAHILSQAIGERQKG